MSVANDGELGRLLLVEDDEVLNRVLQRALARRGFTVAAATSLNQALEAIAAEPPDYAVIDLNIAGSSGLKLIGPLLAASVTCRIVILTGYASIATAVDAIKLGAAQYLAKPVDAETLARTLLEETAPDTELAPEETLSVSRVEWEHIQRVLADNDGNISATARALKMHRRTLQRKLGKRPVRQ